MLLLLLLMKMAKLKKCSMINIKKLRKVKAISSYELAKRIGKSAQYLHQIETIGYEFGKITRTR